MTLSCLIYFSDTLQKTKTNIKKNRNLYYDEYLMNIKHTIMKEEGIIKKGMEHIFKFFDFIFDYTIIEN